MTEILPPLPLQPIESAEEQQGVFDNAQELLAHEEAVHDGIADVTVEPGELDWAVQYAKGYDFMSADWLSKYSRLSYKEACAVVEKMQAQGHLSKQYNTEKGGYLVLKDDQTRERDVNSIKLRQPSKESAKDSRFRKVARALGKLVPAEVKKQTGEFTAGRYGAAKRITGVSAISQKRLEQEVFSQKRAERDRLAAEWELNRKWNLVLGTRPPKHARENGQGNRNTSGSNETPQDLLNEERLAELNKSMKKAGNDAVHQEKEKLGVEKLPQDDFRRIGRAARRRVLREYAGDDASDDLLGRIEEARRALTQTSGGETRSTSGSQQSQATTAKPQSDRRRPIPGSSTRAQQPASPNRPKPAQKQEQEAQDSRPAQPKGKEAGQRQKLSPEEQFEKDMRRYEANVRKYEADLALIAQYESDARYAGLFEAGKLKTLHEEIQEEVWPQYEARLKELNKTLPADKQFSSVEKMPGKEKQPLVKPVDARHTAAYAGAQASPELLQVITLARLKTVGKLPQPVKPKEP